MVTDSPRLSFESLASLGFDTAPSTNDYRSRPSRRKRRAARAAVRPPNFSAESASAETANADSPRAKRSDIERPLDPPADTLHSLNSRSSAPTGNDERGQDSAGSGDMVAQRLWMISWVIIDTQCAPSLAAATIPLNPVRASPTT